MSNSRLTSSTMADSVNPFLRRSRIRDPTKLTLNIWPCRTSNTIAPSWLCVLRTVFETLYITAPSLASRNRYRIPGVHFATLRRLKASKRLKGSANQHPRREVAYRQQDALQIVCVGKVNVSAF